MNFNSYVVLSTLVVAGIVSHAYVVHEQFYPAVVYLSTDKMCLAVMYNFSFALFLLFGKLMLRLFIGTLRDLEVEQLVDSGRGFLADTILFLVFYAPTIDNHEVGTVYLIQYICCVIFMKVFHLTTQIRVSHMFEVGIPRLIVNIKLVSLMLLLLLADVMALQYFYGVASRSSTFFTWILFEALTMSTVVIVSICKYSIHMVDLRLDNGWPGKSVCLFYIDLIHDVVSMTLFLLFMLAFFVQNPSRLPIYMMADVVQVARKLEQRLRSFRRYRRISLNMDARFPDATDEEIDRDEYCVICRDSLFDGSKPKKLPCNHIFHIDCLRSWFVMQQVCPTCRAEISPDAPPASQHQHQHAPQNEQPAAEQVAAQEPLLADQPQAPAQAAAQAAAAGPPSAARAPAAASSGERGQATTAEVPSSVAGSPSASARASGTAAGSPRGSPQAGRPNIPAGGISITIRSTAPSGAGQAAANSHTATAAALSASTAAALSSLQRIEAVHGAVGASSEPTVISIGGDRPEGLPSLAEITESLKQAEEISKFLKEQTDFWMEQVRLIQQDHSHGASVFSGRGAGLSPPPQLSVPVPGLGGAGVGVATQTPISAPASSEPGVGTTSPTAATPPPAPVTPTAGAEEQAPSAAGGVPEHSLSPEEEEADLRNQLAALRRAHEERWKRATSTLSKDST